MAEQVQVYGSIAYVAQTAWIQSGIVRDNILYGKPMDKIRFKYMVALPTWHKQLGFRVGLLEITYSMGNQWTKFGTKRTVMGVLAMKTVVLVTHQVEFLPAVDKILVMEGGEIKQAGNYEQILGAGQTFEQLVNAHKEAMTSADPMNYPASAGSQGTDISPLELQRM